MMPRAICFILGIALNVAGWHTIAAAPPAAETAFFENKIRPLLVQHCYECHSAESADLGGGLRLDTRDGLRQGGLSGPAIVPGEPEKSLLIQALRYEGTEMPPDEPLSAAQIQDVVAWIECGAVDPRVAVPSAHEATSQSLPALWSLQPLGEVSVPKVDAADWPWGAIDRYILARLEKEGLTPTELASSRELARRLYFDLIGLPPTREQLTQFEDLYATDGQSAVELLVDDLLGRPQFGERWGRFWLDVARYGESNGNDGLGRNPTFPHAWRYRDYVIRAFNADMPYHQFLTEQLAGDLLPAESDEQRDQFLIATGFLALSAKPAKAMNTNFEMDVVADQIDVVTRGLLGLGVACARCHDHKFDPVPTRDYYALAGLFVSSSTLWGVAGNEGLTAPPTDLHVLKTPPLVLPPEGFVETVVLLESNTGKPKSIPKSKWEPGTPLAMGVRDLKQPVNCKIHINGESGKLGDEVPRGFLSAIPLGEPADWSIPDDESGRRELARWITHPEHPLTTRVLVNRVWQQLFGEGLVRTPDDFGKYGEPPTHPELLDYLARSFQQQGWSIKRLIREIVTSRTYQLSSQAESALVLADEENRLLARHTRRRLDAEAFRDSILAVSGQLELTPADGSLIRHRDILVNLAGDLHQPSRHRSVYLCYLRNSPPPELAAFNLPEFTTVTGKRDDSTVPGQALYLFNSPFILEQAGHLAEMLIRRETSPEARVELAYLQVLARPPGPHESQQAQALVESLVAGKTEEHSAWAALCQALMISSEFRYVD